MTDFDKEDNIREIFEESIDPEVIIEKIEIIKELIKCLFLLFRHFAKLIK